MDATQLDQTKTSWISGFFVRIPISNYFIMKIYSSQNIYQIQKVWKLDQYLKNVNTVCYSFVHLFNQYQIYHV